MSKLSNFWKDWDEGRFEVSDALTDAGKRPVPKAPSEVSADADEPVSEDIGHWVASAPTPASRHAAWSRRFIAGIEQREEKAFRSLYPFMAVVLAGIMIFFLLTAVSGMPAFGDASSPANSSAVIRRYIEQGLVETGAVNIVAGVILDYRAFDTLGESHVLFTAAIAVFILLLGRKDSEDESERILEDDTILKNTALVLIPIIILFGVYVILNGHLGPGGGFAGGAVIGSGLILYSMAFQDRRLQQLITFPRYKVLVLLCLLFYGLAKCYSFFCGANGLHTIFTTGTPGAIFSAGLILPLNIAVGLVVTLTMYGFYALFTRSSLS